MSDYADNLRKSMINKTRRFMRMVQELKEKDDAALREQVIRMAREACETTNWKPGLGNEHVVEFMARFAALVAAAEREACAKVCEDLDAWNMDDPASTAAKAIRARGEK
jgi:hypothetical protein